MKCNNIFKNVNNILKIGLASCIIFVTSCKTYKPTSSFQVTSVKVLDYSNLDLWAAHFDKIDSSDYTPEGDLVQKIGLCDIFFLHPTTYTGDKNQDQWNAPVDDVTLNQKTDRGSIKFQASVFNLAGRVFAPRYRQAHLEAFFTKDKVSAQKALDFAFEDIKSAFDYYLTHYHQNRPIIIAGHSQGTKHAAKLLEMYFDNKPLKRYLVAAYLIGMPIQKNQFIEISPCVDSTAVGCFVSWRTFKRGFEMPKKYALENISVTNPLSWTTTPTYMAANNNQGTLLFDFHKILPHHMDAQIDGEVLWSNKPKFRGSFFLWTKNYHVADFNFYYFNIRNNALSRAKKFLQSQP